MSGTEYESFVYGKYFISSYLHQKYQKKRRFYTNIHTITHITQCQKSKNTPPGMIFIHYTPIPTLPYPHPGIHIHIHTSSHPPNTPSLTHPYIISDSGICPPIQEQPHNISMSLTCCPIDRSISILCMSIYTRRVETDGGRRERGEGGMGVGCVSERGWGIAYIYV